MELVDHLDVSYVPSAPLNPFQTFDIYIPKHLLDAPHQDALNLVCFIHGGAWRSEDKSDHVSLARKLAVSTGCPVVIPNYRLTPKEPTPDNFLHHPAHAKDILQFLEFVLSWHQGNGGHLPREPAKLFLIGHSCSAHMLSTIFLRMPGDPESVRPSDALARSTSAVIMSEGIYDIDSLLSSFPQYRSWFIEDAFGQSESFENVSVIKATIDPKCQHIRWCIVHSKGDTLIDEQQSQAMYAFLKERSCSVSKSFDHLDGEHDDILNSSQYVDIILNHIQDVLTT